MDDPLDQAVARFRTLTTYRVTLQSSSCDGARQIVRYFYRREGWVRIECVEPHEGAVLVYDPVARRARLWPLGSGFAFAPVLSLAPDSPLIRSPGGHTVDRSDVGTLFANLRALRDHGGSVSVAATRIAGVDATGLEIAAASGMELSGVHRNRVWLARETLFPLKVESYDAAGALVEAVDLADIELDPPLPDSFFTA